jgi:hypothetical protein
MTARNTTRDDEVLHGIKAQINERFFSFKVTLTGSPLAITFAGESLPDMKDADYRVQLSGELPSLGDTCYVDESTISTTGFSVVGGTGAEVAHLFVHGNVDE